MSAHALEQTLYDLGVKREARTAFAEDSAAWLARQGLQPDEVAMVRDFDIAALQAAGVSALLTYGFWMMNAPERTRAAYLARLGAVG